MRFHNYPLSIPVKDANISFVKGQNVYEFEQRIDQGSMTQPLWGWEH